MLFTESVGFGLFHSRHLRHCARVQLCRYRSVFFLWPRTRKHGSPPYERCVNTSVCRHHGNPEAFGCEMRAGLWQHPHPMRSAPESCLVYKYTQHGLMSMIDSCLFMWQQLLVFFNDAYFLLTRRRKDGWLGQINCGE